MNLSEYLSAVKRHLLSQKLSGTYRSESNRIFLVFFLFVGVLNLTLGVLALIVYANLFETSIPYDGDLRTSVYLPSGKVYFYLEMKDFYQTNLRYSKSISHSQLKGERPRSLSSAEPLDYSAGTVIYPAGLLPNSYPQDGFEIEGLEIQTTGIAWDTEMDTVRPSGYTRDEVVPPPLWQEYAEVPDLSLDERFVNWIYISPFSSFRKLWGIIHVEAEGTYVLNVTSRFPYGRKYVSLMQSSFIGPRNYFLCTGMLVIGVLMILFSLLAYRMQWG